MTGTRAWRGCSEKRCNISIVRGNSIGVEFEKKRGWNCSLDGVDVVRGEDDSVEEEGGLGVSGIRAYDDKRSAFF